MVDLHCHILPGLDDGAQTLEDAVDLARAAEDAGIDTIVATPHIREDYPFPLDLIAERAGEVRASLAQAGIAVQLLTAGELALTKIPDLDDDELTALCLGNGPYLLIESPYTQQVPSLLETALFNVQLRGFKPVLAHPERSPSFMSDATRLERLAERGVLCSVTAMSVTGAFGERVRDFTSRLFAAGIVHNVASDSHDASRRGPGLAGALAELAKGLEGGAGSAGWFTEAAPRAILDGTDLPEGPPPYADRRSSWRRLRAKVRLG
jgi:protein-tyrosine phosphatase